MPSRQPQSHSLDEEGRSLAHRIDRHSEAPPQAHSTSGVFRLVTPPIGPIEAGESDEDELSVVHADESMLGTELTEWERDLWDDPGLEEFASQLAADAQYLAVRFPAEPISGSHSDSSHQEGSVEQLEDSSANSCRSSGRLISNEGCVNTDPDSANNTSQPIQPTLQDRAPTRHATVVRFSKLFASLAAMLLLVLLARPLLDAIPSSESTNRIVRLEPSSQGGGESSTDITTSPNNTAKHSVSTPRKETTLPSTDPVHEHMASFTMARTSSESTGTLEDSNHQPMMRSSRFDSISTTPVLYRPEVLFFASQAEMEGILDLMRADRHEKIRVAF